MCRMTLQQCAAFRQREFAEFEPRRNGAAHERVAVRTRDALRRKPAARRHHRLVRRLLVLDRGPEAVRRDGATGLEHVDVERIARMEVPQLVRPDAVPSGIRIVGQQVVDGGAGRALDGRDAPTDALLAAIGLAIEAAFRMRQQAEAVDQALRGGSDRYGGLRSEWEWPDGSDCDETESAAD